MLVTKDVFYWQENSRCHLEIPKEWLKEIKYGTLELTALGGRICYSSEHPLAIYYQDERVYDSEERLAFLLRLAKAKHFSPFAHTPYFYKVKQLPVDFLPPYKAWLVSTVNEDYLCYNVRHLLEFTEPSNREEALRTLASTEVEVEPVKGPYVYSKDKNKWDLVAKNSLEKYKDKAYYLAFVIDYYPWQWFSIVAHKVSRAMSHQFVRHTWLNFTQRSHRYTRCESLDDFVYPPLEASDTTQDFTEAYRDVFDYYCALLEKGVKPEDARFVLPNGLATTVMASGPRFVWEDFVDKRDHPKAQWEIRNFAKAVKDLLNMFC